MTDRVQPRATYRLQLNAEFDFDAARSVVPYLAGLGVSHLYLSPIWAARPGSTHGYDVVDHARINDELGGRAGFDRLAEAAKAHGLGLILDCVPNHMGIGYDNPWWVDVLVWGEASPYSAFFDIDWDPAEPTLAGKVLLPVLGDHYGRVLEDGMLVPGFDGGRPVVRYYEHTVPIFPRDWSEILDPAAARARDAGNDEAAATLADLAGQARQIARRRERVSRQRRRADRERADRLAERLADARQEKTVAEALDAALALFSPGPEAADSARAADRLHRLLERQAYRLAFWRLASQEINYRRFFDINDLAGLRMEEPALFDAAHRLVLELVADGSTEGLRLDHIDGLWDPGSYLQRLRRAARGPDGRLPTIHVEKILGEDEHLRRDWPIEGTTGYEVMGLLGGIQIDRTARRPLMALYRSIVDTPASFQAEVVSAKRLIMATSLGAELNVLANGLNRLAKKSRMTRDYSLTGLRDALANVIAHFPVYRTYVGPKGADDQDRAIIGQAVRGARRAAATPDLSIYDFLASLLTTDAAGSPGFRPSEVVRLARRVQQYTGPVTAKSVEDTAFYRWLPLVALNEVGGEPGQFGAPVEEFHDANAERLSDWPLAMVSTATHDHKRGEDVRARLAVLTERPQDWGRAVRRWLRLARPLVIETEDGPAPSPADQYLFFQTAIGAWPLDLAPQDVAGLDAFRDRLAGYVEKAIREAKRRTSWNVVDEPYETAVRDFVHGALDPDQSERLIGEMAGFAAELAPAGAVNGLARTVLKLTIPGLPDTYQGCEFWDFSLVDPDNRRPVDYAARAAALEALEAGTARVSDLAAAWRDGRIKQAVSARLLAARAADPALFRDGAYRPVALAGPAADTAVAFRRDLPGRTLLVVAPRLIAGRLSDPERLSVDWAGTRVAAEDLPGAIASATDVLTGAPVDPTAVGGPLDALAEAPPALVLRLETRA